MLLMTRLEASRFLFTLVLTSSFFWLVNKPKTLVDTSCYHVGVKKIAIGRKGEYGGVLVRVGWSGKCNSSRETEWGRCMGLLSLPAV